MGNISESTGQKVIDIAIAHETDALKDSDPSGPLYELLGLMAKNPRISIVINNFRMTLQAPKDWQARNAGIFGRISRLVYFDPMVFGYLHNHGAEIITCDNLI